GVLVLVLIGGADGFEIVRDGARAGGGRFGDYAGDLAGAVAGALQRLIERAREARQALLEIVGLNVDATGQRAHRLIELIGEARQPVVELARIEHFGERFERFTALVERALGTEVATVDERDRLRERAAMAVELGGELAEIRKCLCARLPEAVDVLLDLQVGDAGLLRDLV